MNEITTNLKTKFADDLRYFYDEFDKTTIDRANFSEIAGNVLNNTSGFAKQMEKDKAELLILQDQIKDEIASISSLGLPDKTLRGSPHFELVDYLNRYCHFARSSLSLVQIIIQPLYRMVDTGNRIIVEANHCATYIDVNKAVSNEIDNKTKYISSDLKRLEDTQKTSQDKYFDMYSKIIAFELLLKQNQIEIAKLKREQMSLNSQDNTPDTTDVDKPNKRTNEELDKHYLKTFQSQLDATEPKNMKQKISLVRCQINKISDDYENEYFLRKLDISEMSLMNTVTKNSDENIESSIEMDKIPEN